MISEARDFEEEIIVEDSAPNGVEGITDKVTRHTFSSQELPYILIKDSSAVGKKYQLTVLKGLCSPSKHLTQNISLYLRTMEGEWYLLGKISTMQVKQLISLVGLENLSAKLASGRELEGKFIYAMSS